MANLKSNVITHSMSGKGGKTLVFSQRDRLYRRPHALQKEASAAANSLQQVTIYSNSILCDFETSPLLKPARFEVAIADMLDAPDIEKIDLSEYSGNAGDKIVITATYEFEASSVKVSIYNPDNTLAEEGLAVRSENEVDWIYTIISSNTLPGDKVIIQAFDKVGNYSTEHNILY